MEKSFVFRLQYAFLVVLYEKKQLTDEEFLHLSAPLREKMGEKDHELM